MPSSIADESDEKNKVNLKSVVVTSTCSALAVLSHEYCFEKGKEHPEIENKGGRQNLQGFVIDGTH